MRAPPDVSVIIPVHNGERFLAEAIDSVLSQTHPPLEVIVVDDGSSDGTAAVIDRFDAPVRRISITQHGVSAARNLGAREASGELLAFLDADDVWLPQKLELQMLAFNERPHVGLIYTGLSVIDAAGGRIGRRDAPRPEVALRNTLLLEQPSMSIAQTSLIQKSLFAEVGGFDEGLAAAEDVDLACRLAIASPVGCVPDPLVLYRSHPGQKHLDPELTERDGMKVLEKLFAHPDLPQSLANGRRRAEANLYVSVAGRHLRAERWRRAADYVVRAGRLRPDRVIAGASRYVFS